MQETLQNNIQHQEPSLAEMVTVITDFLEMGHVDNIIAMFKQDPSYYTLTGQLIQDERFMVRVGVAVLLEELAAIRPDQVELAIPNLVPLLSSQTSYVRGEAANLLGIIGTEEAVAAVAPLRNDPDPQVREIVSDILADITE